jgi:hypothetical protein
MGFILSLSKSWRCVKKGADVLPDYRETCFGLPLVIDFFARFQEKNHRSRTHVTVFAGNLAIRQNATMHAAHG